DMLEDFPDGVWLVELAPLVNARLVPQAAATVLGVKEASSDSVVQALARHCADRSLMLLLDNCEHLIGACAELVSHLLQVAPKVKILATSRERLNVRGETAFPLAPLVVHD